MPGRRIIRGFLAPLSAVLGLLVLAPAARAELVVLTDGQFFKVKDYQLLDDDRMRMTLVKGGRITLPIGRIERVIDDEVPYREPVVAAPAEPLPAQPTPPVLPSFDWRFAAEHEVPATPYGELIYQMAKRYEINPSLIAAVVWAESGFAARARSPKGARGLMQLMPATAQRFGVGRSQLYEPLRNLQAGTAYLRFLLDRYSPALDLALAAYNAGEGAVDRYQGVPPYRETRGYVKRILGALGLEAATVASYAPPAEPVAAGAP